MLFWTYVHVFSPLYHAFSCGYPSNTTFRKPVIHRYLLLRCLVLNLELLAFTVAARAFNALSRKRKQMAMTRSIVSETECRKRHQRLIMWQLNCVQIPSQLAKVTYLSHILLSSPMAFPCRDWHSDTPRPCPSNLALRTWGQILYFLLGVSYSFGILRIFCHEYHIEKLSNFLVNVAWCGKSERALLKFTKNMQNKTKIRNSLSW